MRQEAAERNGHTAKLPIDYLDNMGACSSILEPSEQSPEPIEGGAEPYEEHMQT